MKTFIFSIALLFMSAIAYCQWVPVTSITTGDVGTIYFTDSNTGFATTSTGTILKTSNATIISELFLDSFDNITYI